MDLRGILAASIANGIQVGTDKNDKKVEMLTVLKLQSPATSFILFSSVPVILIISFASGIVHILSSFFKKRKNVRIHELQATDKLLISK